MASQGFAPVVLRNATAFGASPRMRFDVVLNNLAACAYTTGRIVMTSDGAPWRPLVHVRDICKAIICAIDAPIEAVYAETFNVGSNAQNYRVRDIAAMVGERFTGCAISLGASGGDTRSYRVSFDRIHERLPGFSCDWDARSGVAELHELFGRLHAAGSAIEHRAFTRIEAMKHLLRTGQVDADLFWV
jgi:nucleoside-diphosphate-sugar epimerase